jgi:hypothetical protein
LTLHITYQLPVSVGTHSWKSLGRISSW